VKLISLIENTSDHGLAGEHGLSVWMELGGRVYLLDTGASGAYADNARELGLDLSKVRGAFLSHGHYDHAGGVARFLEENDTAKVYLRSSACQGHFVRREDGTLEDIGVHQGLLEGNPQRFVLVDSDVEVEPGVWLLADQVENTRQRAEETGMLCGQNDGTLVPDSFDHEQSVVLEGGDGLVILNSCCHAGVVEIVKSVQRRFPDRKIQAVVGGFHLMASGGTDTLGVSPEQVVELGQALFDLGVRKLVTGHCTGTPALALLQQAFGERVIHFTTGTVLEF
jgi:7,8-dihydropterin-6-yl-methyl-4-(beta-D-ribofuranosyl)aminobenzene 5'-phosphate synthase